MIPHKKLEFPATADDIPELEHQYAKKIRSVTHMHTALGVAVLENSVVSTVLCSTVNWSVLASSRSTLSLDTGYPASSPWAVSWGVIEHLTEQVAQTPDLIFVYGEGIDHERRFGLACHVGLTFNLPTIAVQEAGPSNVKVSTQGILRGSTVAVQSDNQGPTRMHVTTQEGQKPIAVSVGHMLNIQQAVAETLRASIAYRMPQPIHLAQGLQRA